MGAQFIVDAFWGDAGKGKFAAFLSTKEQAAGCIRAGIGPNAGHSIYVDGRLIKARLLPLGFMCPSTKLFIGPGVAVDPVIFLSEVAQTSTEGRAFIDYRCPVILEEHKERERNDPQLKKIDSTMSGAGAARADYIMRRGNRAESVQSLKPYIIDVAEECNKIASKGTLIVEGSQATFLSSYLSYRYPYTTSDNCTTLAFADDIGLNWKLIDKVLLLVKCLPTAVGNGPLPNEMTREEILQSGLAEYGVNTGRFRRRMRGIDRILLAYSVMLNGPTEIALTYCDQYDSEMKDCVDAAQITSKMRELIAQIELWTNTPVSYLETGKDYRSILPLRAASERMKNSGNKHTQTGSF